MPEPTAASVPPEPLFAKTRRPRGESNRAFLNELNDAGKVAQAALAPVQLTADQAWPWRTPRVISFRRAFLLPTDRPLTDQRAGLAFNQIPIQKISL